MTTGIPKIIDAPHEIFVAYGNHSGGGWSHIELKGNDVKYIRADIVVALQEKINALPQWQPIETTPKTSKAILVYCSHQKNIYTAYYRREDGFVQTPGWEEPTHWMPLPAGPK